MGQHFFYINKFKLFSCDIMIEYEILFRLMYWTYIFLFFGTDFDKLNYGIFWDLSQNKNFNLPTLENLLKKKICGKTEKICVLTIISVKILFISIATVLKFSHEPTNLLFTHRSILNFRKIKQVLVKKQSEFLKTRNLAKG